MTLLLVDRGYTDTERIYAPLSQGLRYIASLLDKVLFSLSRCLITIRSKNGSGLDWLGLFISELYKGVKTIKQTKEFLKITHCVHIPESSGLHIYPTLWL